MASSSTSSVPKSFKYDVFLSFRGEDARNKFLAHLHLALEKKSINTYMDDKRIKKGKRIDDQLIQSIEDSRFHIVVFSKNYASSSWCLDELVKIMECHNDKATEQKAYPVFYDVEPTEVRKQIGAVGRAFAKNKKEKDATKWRKALKEAAGVAGWELKKTANGNEAKFIQKIVQEISLELRSFSSSADKKLIGMETRIKDVVSSLEIGCDDVRMIGIKGMGGAGKTTLARALFDQISFQFEGKSFVENVREFSKSNFSGLKKLQKQVLSDVLHDRGITVSNISDGKNMMRKMMSSRKVLVVLDDVDHREQLEGLAGEHSWFKPGSRIIITTRDEQVLVAHRVNSICDVNLLSYDEAICLFSRYAFGREIPIQGYEELSRQVERYAAGLPLTIKVLGSDLCGKDGLEWIDAIERLKKIPLKETLEKLELSYKGLEDDYKEIFLDIACIMKGWRKKKAIRVLVSCGFNARIGLRVLEQKSLITISEYGFLHMHDHLQEMGWNIVRRSHPDEPEKHSRLWVDKEIEEILADDLGTEATRCIKPFQWKLNPKLVMKGLGNMKKLRFLDVSFKSNDNCSDSNWKFDEVRPCLPNALRYLHLEWYPFLYLPKTFRANNLVHLKMTRGNSVQLWEGGERKVLQKLIFLKLNNVKWKTIDLGLIPNLETLKLRMVELQMNGECLNLKSLAISWSKLSCLDLRHTPNLEILRVYFCVNLEELHLPVGCSRLKSLDISFSKLTTLNLRHTMNLERLTIDNCVDFVELHVPVECLKLISLCLHLKSELSTLDLRPFLNLETLHFTGCDEVEELHMPVRFLNLKSCFIEGSKLRTLIELERAPNLEKLILVESVAPIELHMCDSSNVQLWEGGERKVLDKLKFLKLCDSKLKAVDLGLTPNLETLSLEGCADLVELHMPVGCLNLESLMIEDSKLKTVDFGRTPNLKTLFLEGCFDLVELHMNDGCLNLESLSIKGSKLKSLDLGWTLNLETLYLEGCWDLTELHMSTECPKLKLLDIIGSRLTTLDLGRTPNLETSSLLGCDDLVELHMHAGCLNLESLIIENSKLKSLDLGRTPNLKTLFLEGCCDLVELHMHDGCLKLESLAIKGSKLKSLDLGRTLNLETFYLEGCWDLTELHMSAECPKLKYLNIIGSRSTTLDLGRTPHLETLHLNTCPKLISLYLTHSKLRTHDIGLTPNLKSLHLKECYNLVELHAPVGCLKKFVDLNLSGCVRIISPLFNKILRSLEVGLLAQSDLIVMSVYTCSLHSENNLPKFRFEFSDIADLLSSTKNLEKLISAGLYACIRVNFNIQQSLDSTNSIPKVHKDIDRFECLEELSSFFL